MISKDKSKKDHSFYQVLSWIAFLRRARKCQKDMPGTLWKDLHGEELKFQPQGELS